MVKSRIATLFNYHCGLPAPDLKMPPLLYRKTSRCYGTRITFMPPRLSISPVTPSLSQEGLPPFK